MSKKLLAEVARAKLSSDWREQCRKPGYRMERLNSLAFPKGENPICELTGEPAKIQLITPFVNLSYSTKRDAEVSWAGIMHKLCPLLGPLRNKQAIIGSEEERARRQKTLDVSLRALIDLCKNEASRYLSEKRYNLAVPGALQSLKFAKDVFGPGHQDLVPSYILLAEANIGLQSLVSAEEQLAQANFIILNHPESSNSLRSQLHRNFGKLYTVKGDIKEALEHVSKDNQVEHGLSFYDKVVDIWYKFLATLRTKEDVDVLNAAQTAEARLTLERILTTRQQYLGENHIATGEAKYTLGLLHVFLGAQIEAKQKISEALAIYTKQLGETNASTLDVKHVLQQLKASDAKLM